MSLVIAAPRSEAKLLCNLSNMLDSLKSALVRFKRFLGMSTKDIMLEIYEAQAPVDMTADFTLYMK